MNQVLFRVRESKDLLSNRVWDLFLTRLDGEIKGECLGAQGHQWRREKGTLLFLDELNEWEREESVKE